MFAKGFGRPKKGFHLQKSIIILPLDIFKETFKHLGVISFMEKEWLNILTNLLVATMAGGAISWERSYHGRPVSERILWSLWRQVF